MRLSAKFILKLSFSLLLTLNYAKAGLVDAISVIINNEPITLYEVYKYSQKLKISKKEALSILIRQKLEDAEIKKLHTKVTDDEVNRYIENVASKNGMSLFKFYETLKAQGIDEDVYKKDIATKIKRDKLYRKIFIRKNLKPISEKQAKEYYEKNQNEFITTDEFDTIVYESKDKEALTKIRKNPMAQIAGVVVKNKTFKTGNFSQKLEALFNKTKSGEFTPVLNFGDKFAMFYINKKNGIKKFPFEKVKNYIIAKLSSKQEKDAIDEYFEKIKSNADIKVLRKP